MEKNALDLLALIVSIIALVVSVRVQQMNRELQVKINQQDSTLESRRLFLALWEKLVEVHRIDSRNPVATHVALALNTMELVALLWEAGVIDKDMVVISFGDNYVERYNEINQISSSIPGDGRNGRQLLQIHPAIDRVLPQIKDRLAERAKVGTK